MPTRPSTRSSSQAARISRIPGFGRILSVKDGVVTPEGIAELRVRMPHADVDVTVKLTTDTVGFEIKPDGFFDRNPALDAPTQP
jgi:hypothetical protein